MMVKKEEEYQLDYGKIALTFVIIIIGFWFLSHFRVSIIPVDSIQSISNMTYYDCPGVSLKTDISGYLGCEFHHTENQIQSTTLKEGIVLWWK